MLAPWASLVVNIIALIISRPKWPAITGLVLTLLQVGLMVLAMGLAFCA